MHDTHQEVDIADVGRRIGKLMTVILVATEVSGLQEHELTAMSDYAQRLETTGPILDPTGYRNMPNQATAQVRWRIKLIKRILQIEDHVEDERKTLIRWTIEELFK